MDGLRQSGKGPHPAKHGGTGPDTSSCTLKIPPARGCCDRVESSTSRLAVVMNSVLREPKQHEVTSSTGTEIFAMHLPRRGSWQATHQPPQMAIQRLP